MDSFVSIFTTQWGNIVRWWNGILDNLANVLVGLAVCLLLCFLSKKLAHWVSRGLSRLFRKWPTVEQGIYTSLRDPLRGFLIMLGIFALFKISGTSGGFDNFLNRSFRIVTIALVTWPKYARMARSLVLKVRHTDYVYAAIVTGSSTWRMLWKYMLPNTITTLVITAATDIGGMMMELAALSFLGFGAQPPTPEWGSMLNEGRDFMQSAPWLMVYPGVAIFITVVIFNMLGDNLRDILDPREE